MTLSDAALLAAPGDAWSETEFAELSRLADLAFTEGRLEEAEAHYELLVAHARGGHGAQLRRVHVQLLKREPERALQLLDELRSDPEYGVNAERLRSLALFDLERYDEAAGCLRGVVTAAPDDAAFARLFVSALKRTNAMAELEQFEHLLLELDEAERFELRLRARLARGDFSQVRRLCEQEPASGTAAGGDLVASVVRELVRDEEHVQAEELAGLFDASSVESRALCVAAAAIAIARGDWPRADAWLRRAESLDGAGDDDDLRIRRVQLLCYELRLEEAEDALAGWADPAAVPTRAVGIVAGLYAARGRFTDVVGLLAHEVSRGSAPEGEAFVETIALAARATQRYGEIRFWLDRSLADHPGTEVAGLCDRLAVEISLLRSLGLLEGNDDPAVLRIGDPLYREREALLSGLVTSAPARPATPRSEQPPLAERLGDILFCADGTYLLGTCVAVGSLLRHNPGVTTRRRVLVVCPDETAELATAALDEIAGAHAARVDVLPAATVLGDGPAAGLRTGWGCFTPGHGLSEAAYYRMFSVRHLLVEGGRSRLLYVDSDACVGPGVEELIDVDLQGLPLGARFELPLPSIEQAVRRLDLDLDTYFNSGVLLFALDHPELLARVSEAIDIAIEQPHLLTFLDQCALNLAFAGSTAGLRDAHNFYVRPKDEVDAGARPVIRHFLTRWKPWDPTYPGPNNLPWLDELRVVGEALSTANLRRLLSLSL